jgi:hypothetical protein
MHWRTPWGCPNSALWMRNAFELCIQPGDCCSISKPDTVRSHLQSRLSPGDEPVFFSGMRAPESWSHARLCLLPHEEYSMYPVSTCQAEHRVLRYTGSREFSRRAVPMMRSDWERIFSKCANQIRGLLDKGRSKQALPLKYTERPARKPKNLGITTS